MTALKTVKTFPVTGALGFLPAWILPFSWPQQRQTGEQTTPS